MTDVVWVSRRFSLRLILSDPRHPLCEKQILRLPSLSTKLEVCHRHTKTCPGCDLCPSPFDQTGNPHTAAFSRTPAPEVRGSLVRFSVHSDQDLDFLARSSDPCL